jgi:hypothetical protein
VALLASEGVLGREDDEAIARDRLLQLIEPDPAVE